MGPTRRGFFSTTNILLFFFFLNKSVPFTQHHTYLAAESPEQKVRLSYSPAANTDLLCDLRLISKAAVFCSEVALQLPARGGAGQKQSRTQDTNYPATGLHTWGGQMDRCRSSWNSLYS